jgi:hypothetical protein
MVTLYSLDKIGEYFDLNTFQLVFSARTVFSSHPKSANCVFQSAYQHSRTGPKCLEICSSNFSTVNTRRGKGIDVLVDKL